MRLHHVVLKDFPILYCILFTFYLDTPTRVSCWEASQYHDAAATVLHGMVGVCVMGSVWCPPKIASSLKAKKQNFQTKEPPPACLFGNSSDWIWAFFQTLVLFSPLSHKTLTGGFVNLINWHYLDKNNLFFVKQCSKACMLKAIIFNIYMQRD